MKGIEKGGVGGFFLGSLKGIAGLVVKPVSGVIDAASITAEGIKNTPNIFNNSDRIKNKRKHNPRPFYEICH
jgi:vacuolar protein sorting-associated protein 13A/C